MSGALFDPMFEANMYPLVREELTEGEEFKVTREGESTIRPIKVFLLTYYGDIVHMREQSSGCYSIDKSINILDIDTF